MDRYVSSNDDTLVINSGKSAQHPQCLDYCDLRDDVHESTLVNINSLTHDKVNVNINVKKVNTAKDNSLECSKVRASPEEEEMISQVKNLLQKYEVDQSIQILSKYTDMCILRFIRGRGHDTERAFKAIIKNYKWREENIPGIDAKVFAHEIAARKMYIEGYDGCKRPVLHIVARKHNKYERDLAVLQQFLIHTLEEIMKLTNSEEKLTILFDLNGFGLNCMDYEAVQMLVKVLQFNYPEILSVAYVLNAPYIFSACWLVIRPWLDPVTASKVQFINSIDVLGLTQEKL